MGAYFISYNTTILPISAFLGSDKHGENQLFPSNSPQPLKKIIQAIFLVSSNHVMS